MRNFFNTVGALAAGLGVMYFCDPERGRIRRAVAADRIRRRSKEFRHLAKVQYKRARNRLRGLRSNARYQLSSTPVEDEQLNAQVRSRLGRLVGHPGAIDTRVRDGCLRLSGPILAGELRNLMSHLWELNGLKAIDNRLSVRDHPGREPALQGKPRPVRHSHRNGSVPLLVAAGAVACGFLSESRALRAGALSAAALVFAADAYRRSARMRRGRRGPPEHWEALDYRPFNAAPADAIVEVKHGRS